MKTGDLLNVQCTKDEYNAMLWTFVDYSIDKKKVICDAVGDKEVRISIAAEKVTAAKVAEGALCLNERVNIADKHQPLALSRPEQQLVTMTDEICPMTFTWSDRFNIWLDHLFRGVGKPDLGYYCNVRIPIAGWGGNSIVFKQTSSQKLNEMPLMYPRLIDLGLSMTHVSQWGHTEIRLQLADILRPCPAGQIWVWCSYCKRFLFPAESHRAGRLHVRALTHLEWYGADYIVQRHRN